MIRPGKMKYGEKGQCLQAVAWQSISHNARQAAVQSNYQCQWEDGLHSIE